MEKNKQQIWRGIAIGLIYPSLCAVTERLSGKGLPHGPFLLRVISVIAVLGGTALLIDRKGSLCLSALIIPSGLWFASFMLFPLIFIAAPDLSIIDQVSGVIPSRTFVVLAAMIYIARPLSNMAKWLGLSLLLSMIIQGMIRFYRIPGSGSRITMIQAKAVQWKRIPPLGVLTGFVPVLIWMVSLGLSHFCPVSELILFAEWNLLPIFAGLLAAVILWKRCAAFDPGIIVSAIWIIFISLCGFVMHSKDPNDVFLTTLFLFWVISVSLDTLMLLNFCKALLKIIRKLSILRIQIHGIT